MKQEKYTIKDIAKMAQVSRGTVDRVIHGRGTVSKETYNRIKLIIDKLNYKPNLIARALKKGEAYRLAVLMPDYEFDVFWKRPFDGIEKAAMDYSTIGVKLDKFLFNPLKSQDFRDKAKIILKGNYLGVLIAPVFYKESKDFFEKFINLNLPYITFNTFIEDSQSICHIGQDLKQSGKTAASLLSKLVKNTDEILIIHIEEVLENSRHMQEKELGFKQYFNDSSHSAGPIHVLKLKEINRIEEKVLQKLEAYPKIQGIFVSTSKAHHIACILDKHNIFKYIVGYDLIEENVNYLNSGKIDFLIYQNPGSQANQGISSLVDFLVFKMEIPDKKLLPIEIIIKENIKNYLQ
ncbi:MAG: substrate-binding domain-containing protein [Bacteroidota bacterium]|nr:substrate-binding domain-containing protein [Bacteroidota bacterium]